MSHLKTEGEAGFSIVEMIVAVALFVVVMLVSVTALLALVDANRKARSLESVMNNLNIAIDGMVRSMRMGSEYHCDADVPPIIDVRGCLNNPAASVAFLKFGGSVDTVADYWIYAFDSDGSLCGANRLCKSENGGQNYYALTAPDININEAYFYVMGVLPGDEFQPKIVIILKGVAGSGKARTSSTFSIQATAVQRVLDI